MCGKKESERNPTSFFSLVVLTPETRSAANSILRRIMVDLCVVMVGRLKRGEVTPFEVSPASRRRVAALSNGHDGARPTLAIQCCQVSVIAKWQIPGQVMPDS